MGATQILLMLVVLVAVVVVGVTMAATGASADTFLAMVVLGAGITLVGTIVKYHRDPTYTADGQVHTVGLGGFLLLYAFAIILLAGGVFVAIYGIPQGR